MNHIDKKIKIAQRVISEFKNGQIINLGVGIPTIIPDLLKSNSPFYFQTENGLLGVGPSPKKGEEDWDNLNASKKPITELKGSAFFDSVESFAMIRGCHIDVAVLGALQVDEQGHIANWVIPNKPILGVGGAMDLISGAKKVIIAMTHLSKDGHPKIVESLKLPRSGNRPADLIITDLAVFRRDGRILVLEEISDLVTLDELRDMTEAKFSVAEKLQKYEQISKEGKVYETIQNGFN
jgi:3-oxoacid CoA-transferase B subunit